tara:strand:- start:232 stop:555 length:324 start_codon:yes stop_codon:yes gene_type:complete
MSFEDEMMAGFAEADNFAGESFTMGNHNGSFRGVFKGDDAPTEFDKIQGFETKTTNALSVSKLLFLKGAPPMINELITKANSDRYNIIGIESVDEATWEIMLQKRDV